MKTLIALVFAFVSFYANGQSTAYGNFKVSDQEIIYQKIFSEDSVTVKKLEMYYQSLPYVSSLTTQANGVEFDVTDLKVDYKKFEFSQMNTPSIIQTGKYSGHVAVGIKDGKYRVTFNTIMVTGDIGYKKITTADKLTNYACKSSGTVLAPDWTRPNMLGLLDKAFTDNLQFVAPKKKADKSDW